MSSNQGNRRRPDDEEFKEIETKKRRLRADDDDDYDVQVEGDDDDDEEEDEMNDSEFEEDDEDSAHVPARRGAFGDVKGFLLDEADVDDDEEEEEEDEDEEEEEGDYEEAGTNDRETEVDHSHRRVLNTLLFDDATADQIGEFYNKRYASYKTPRRKDAEGLSQQELALLSGPRASDANIYALRRRMNEEKISAFNVLRRFLANGYSKEFDIKSIVVKEGVRGYIYLETDRKASIHEAFEGVGAATRGPHNQLILLPREQMMEVVQVPKRQRLTVGTWVRMKRGGLYRGDVGLVYALPCSQRSRTVTLKLIPRIDYSKNGSSRKRRFPQRLLDVAALRALGADPVVDGDIVSFENQTFTRAGFLLKKFPMSSITWDNIVPNNDEMECFRKDSETVESIMSNESLLPELMVGDNVSVKSGELRGCVGRVVKVEEKQGRIIVHFGDRVQIGVQVMQRDALVKCFSNGDHVRVLSGRHENETGLVVDIDTKLDEARILCDTSMHEIRVCCQELRLHGGISSGVDKTGRFELGQMVVISGQEIGVLVRMEREDFHVLNIHGNLVTCHRSSVSTRTPKTRARCHDSCKCLLSVQDHVKVVNGQFAEQEGIIKFIFRQNVFVQLANKVGNMNGGIIAIAGRLLQNLENKRGNNSSFLRTMDDGAKVSRPPYQANRGIFKNGRDGGGRFGRDYSMIGKKVKVLRGPYKGDVGLVKDADDTNAKVELQSAFKIVFMERTDLMELDKLIKAQERQASQPVIPEQVVEATVEEPIVAFTPAAPEPTVQTPFNISVATPAAQEWGSEIEHSPSSSAGLTPQTNPSAWNDGEEVSETAQQSLSISTNEPSPTTKDPLPSDVEAEDDEEQRYFAPPEEIDQ